MPPGLHALGGRAQQRELELGQRLGAPAEVRALVQHPEPGARRVDERAVEAASSAGRSSASAQTTRTFVAPSLRDVLLELACAALVLLDGDDLSGELRRLAARRGAEIERALALTGARPRARRATEPRLCGQMRPSFSAAASTRATRSTPGTSVASPSISPRTSTTMVSGGSFCARMSAIACSMPEVALPDFGDPVRVRELERPVRQRVEQLAEADPTGAA